MLKNANCTLYRYNAGTQGYDRCLIPDVYWHESRGGNVLKSGLQSIHGVTAFIYKGGALPTTPTKDMLVKGVCNFEFDNSSQKAVADSFEKFKKKHSFVTVMSVDDCTFGSLKHWEVSAK